MNNEVYICLENGQKFKGYRFGAAGDVIGELVFTNDIEKNCDFNTDAILKTLKEKFDFTPNGIIKYLDKGF